MLKIIEDLVNKNVEKYTQIELSKVVNRPNEGEIVKIGSIKIKDDFKEPGTFKMLERRYYYNEHKYFKNQIVLNAENYLVDGYITYLLAKEKGFDYITIIREG